MIELANQIESLLFVSNKPLTVKHLAKYTKASESEIKLALNELSEARQESGVVLLMAENQYQLATHSKYTELVRSFLNADLKESLTEATVEVLAITSYRQPISKVEIEAIRGVNSQYSIRALLMRGLIEKVPNPEDARGMLYQTTTEFLQHLGLQSNNDLPNFTEVTKSVKLPDVPLVKSETTSQDEITEPLTTEDSESVEEN